MLRIALVVLVAIGCTEAKTVAGEVGGTVTEWIACPTDLIDCGHVYLCDTPADNELGGVEVCVNDDEDDGAEQLDAAELAFGACELTPRHQGLCRHCCGADCPRGCNAFNGCYCP